MKWRPLSMSFKRQLHCSDIVLMKGKSEVRLFTNIPKNMNVRPSAILTCCLLVTGDIHVCRNLVRIVAAVVDAWVDILEFGVQVQNDTPANGAISLLVKGASHPSVHVCAISLPVLARILPRISSLPQELLPVLQRKAIIPHHLRDGQISFDTSDICGVSFHDFQIFRMTVLSEALVACFRESGDHYMDSCISAVEEFCSVLSSSDVSLQLEAALFCIEQVSSSLLNGQNANMIFDNQMKRIYSVVPAKPPSLMSNPITRERMCRFIRKVSVFFSKCSCVSTTGHLPTLILFVLVSALACQEWGT
jgi:hypothetical protein